MVWKAIQQKTNSCYCSVLSSPSPATLWSSPRYLYLRKELVQVDTDTNEILVCFGFVGFFFSPLHKQHFIYSNVTFVSKCRVCKSQEDQTSHRNCRTLSVSLGEQIWPRQAHTKLLTNVHYLLVIISYPTLPNSSPSRFKVELFDNWRNPKQNVFSVELKQTKKC